MSGGIVTARSSPLTQYPRNNHAPRPVMTQTRALLLGLFLAAVAPPWAAAQTLPAGYAGSDTCKVCHEDIYNGLAKNPHHALAVDAKTRMGGPRVRGLSRARARRIPKDRRPDNIQNPAKLSAAAADKICLTCHLNQPTQVGRLESSHAHNQISCTACHKMHSSEQPLVVRKADATNKLCASCHLNEWAQFQRPVPSQASRRRDELRGLPQSARQHPSRHAAELRRQ